MASPTQFFVVLPSNASMSVYPDNTLTSYKTRLSNPLHLIGNWEVGVVEVQYPQTWFNVTERNNSFTYSESGREMQYGKISHGFYEKAQDIIDAINDNLSATGRNAIRFSVHPHSKKVQIRLRPNAYIYFNDELYLMLGLKNKSVSVSTEGTLPADISNGFYSMFIYSDIVEPQMVGDTCVPLLRNITVKTGGVTQGNAVYRVFNSPHYVPVRAKYLETIQIDIRKDTGENVPFERGKLMVKLHFRRVRPSLFS